MKAILFSLLILASLIIEPSPGEKDRIFIYYDTEITTTYDVPETFLGNYTGRKSGYLKLYADGTGEYKYDIFGMAPASCKRQPILLIWGFILDKQGEITKNKRDYGYSYPLLLQSTGATSFQGCRKTVMKDFILQRGNSLHVSSSDDWQKDLN